MKNWYVVVLLSLVTSAAYAAQSTETVDYLDFKSESSLRLLPQIGVSSFSWSGADTNIGDIKASSNPGFNAGLLADIHIANAFWFETGAVYQQVGSAWKASGEKLTLSVGLMTLPVLAKVEFIQLDKFAMHLRGGANVGFQVSRSASYEFEGETVELDMSDYDGQSPQIFGLAGLGTSFAVDNNKEFTLDFAYQRGFSKITKSQTSTADGRYQGFTLSAGLGFLI